MKRRTKHCNRAKSININQSNGVIIIWVWNKDVVFVTFFPKIFARGFQYWGYVDGELINFAVIYIFTKFIKFAQDGIMIKDWSTVDGCDEEPFKFR